MRMDHLYSTLLIGELKIYKKCKTLQTVKVQYILLLLHKHFPGTYGDKQGCRLSHMLKEISSIKT